MRVYRANNDISKYRYFLAEHEKDALALYNMSCIPKAENWKPPQVVIEEPGLEEGDFYQFGSGTWILSPKATNILKAFLEEAGELLPLSFEGQTFTVFNVTNCVDCLDQDRTWWFYNDSTRTRSRPQKYEFDSVRLSRVSIFKIPQTSGSEILVVEGLRSIESEFRYLVEQTGIKGLFFEEIWSDEI